MTRYLCIRCMRKTKKQFCPKCGMRTAQYLPKTFGHTIHRGFRLSIKQQVLPDKQRDHQTISCPSNLKLSLDEYKIRRERRDEGRAHDLGIPEK